MIQGTSTHLAKLSSITLTKSSQLLHFLLIKLVHAKTFIWWRAQIEKLDRLTLVGNVELAVTSMVSPLCKRVPKQGTKEKQKKLEKRSLGIRWTGRLGDYWRPRPLIDTEGDRAKGRLLA